MTEPADIIIIPEYPGWRRTLWAMVGIQLLMTGSFGFLSPIVPLMLPGLGVNTLQGVDIWSGVITGSTSFVAAFASPLWGRIADRRGRKLSLLRSSCAVALFTAVMGLSTNVWQFCAAHSGGAPEASSSIVFQLRPPSADRLTKMLTGCIAISRRAYAVQPK